MSSLRLLSAAAFLLAFAMCVCVYEVVNVKGCEAAICEGSEMICGCVHMFVWLCICLCVALCLCLCVAVCVCYNFIFFIC